MKKLLSSLLIALTVMIAVIPAHASLPAGYTELEYIESTRTQYIDTGIKTLFGTDAFTITTTVATTENSTFGSLLGNKPDDGHAAGLGLYINTIHTDKVLFSHNAPEKQLNVSSVNFYDGQFHTLTAYYDGNGKGGYVIDGTTFEATGVNTATVDNDNNYYILKNGGNLRFKGKVKTINIVVGNTERYNLVPAMNSNNVIGMYDTVSNTFFTNAGTGTFTAGPAKCRNLFDKNAVTANGGGAGVSLSDYIPVVAGQPYYIGDRGSVAVVKEYDADKHYIQTLYLGVNPYTPSANTAFARLNVSNSYLDTFQFEAGSTATAYVPFCANPIKIATTAYNSARFNPVKTDLDSAVATIREIVTKTINQTAAIASLQADKQTRPEEQCPAGKKCLLVETEENGVIVPHWFPIIEDVD